MFELAWLNKPEDRGAESPVSKETGVSDVDLFKVTVLEAKGSLVVSPSKGLFCTLFNKSCQNLILFWNRYQPTETTDGPTKERTRFRESEGREVAMTE